MAVQLLSIGRGEECTIRIVDGTQRVSRNHATLKLTDSGNYFITDHSVNGTYVNGIRISPNVDFPVKRGDSIAFANVSILNWDLVPRKIPKVLVYGLIGLAGLLVVTGGILWLANLPEKNLDTPSVPLTDSLQVERQTIDPTPGDTAVPPQRDTTVEASQESVTPAAPVTPRKVVTPSRHEKDRTNRNDSTDTQKETIKKQYF